MTDPALQAIGEIIHDLDIQDGKCERPQTPGFGQRIDDICKTQRDNMARIAHGAALQDGTYERFKPGRVRKRAGKLSED